MKHRAREVFYRPGGGPLPEELARGARFVRPDPTAGGAFGGPFASMYDYSAASASVSAFGYGPGVNRAPGPGRYYALSGAPWVPYASHGYGSHGYGTNALTLAPWLGPGGMLR